MVERLTEKPKPVEDGFFFVDGSGWVCSNHRWLRRCGWSWIKYSLDKRSEEIHAAMDILTLCIKAASAEQILAGL